jgi:hypothetical protein
VSYEFSFIGGVNNSYVFETKNGIVYEVRFKPSPYLLNENANYSNLIYEFVIDVAINLTDKNPPLDSNVSDTIAVIFREFFIKNSYNICIYICDSSDGRQDIRRRKFDDWFYKYQKESFVKLDEILLDSKQNRYPISLVVLKKNPYFKEIVVAFAAISENNK